MQFLYSQYCEKLRSPLPESTENGFAQAIWLSNHSSREFLVRFPGHQPSSEAYEAKVKLSMTSMDFSRAAEFAELWVEDQPFSTEAIVRYLNLRAIHTTPDSKAVALAKRAATIFDGDWHVSNACSLLLTEVGEHAVVSQVLKKLKKETPAGASKAFVEAGRGFLAFAMGDFSVGRDAYEAAVRIARQHQASELLVNSTMFWLRCEAINGLITEKAIGQVSQMIEKGIQKTNTSERQHLGNIWHSVKQRTLAVDLPDDPPEAGKEKIFLESVVRSFDDPDFIK